MADPLTYLEDLAARITPEVGDAMREAIAAQRASHLEGARLMRIMEEARLEEAKRLESERDAALARAERYREAVYQAHADLGADGGVTEVDCTCEICCEHRASAALADADADGGR